MLKIKRLGLIYQPSFDGSWKDNSCLQPTPMLMSDRLRVFMGQRDPQGVSRIGYVDLALDDLTKVIAESESPVLDIGEDGCFDDNGVVSCAVLHEDNKTYLFYAGYLLPKKFKFHVFSGLAVSSDGGKSFTRCIKVPIFDRTSDETCFRVIHSIFKENDKYRIYYGGGSSVVDQSKPIYDIRYLESDNIFSFPQNYQTVIPLDQNRTRVGRPYVIKENNSYYMFYGYSDANHAYKLEYAISSDGLNWESKPLELYGGDSSLDAQMSAYPAPVKINNKWYILYNGNDYGKYGILLGEVEL